MKISLTDLNVIVDSLLGSAGIVDDYGNLFKYTADTREGVAKKLIKEMSKVDLDVGVKYE